MWFLLAKKAKLKQNVLLVAQTFSIHPFRFLRSPRTLGGILLFRFRRTSMHRVVATLSLLINFVGRMRSKLIPTFVLVVCIALCVLSVPSSLFKVGLLGGAQSQSKLIELTHGAFVGKFSVIGKLFISFNFQF